MNTSSLNVTLDQVSGHVSEDPDLDTTLATTENQTYQATLDDLCLEIYNDVNDSVPALRLFRFVVYGILLTLIGLLGIAGNLISITILSRPKMRSSINCCLIGLTSFDMIVAVTSILMFGLPEISEFTNTMIWYANGVYQRVTPFVYPLGLIAQTGSVYLTVTVTMERYVAVCLPLRARYLCTYGRAKIYVITVACFSVLYNLPRFWEVTFKECKIPDEDNFVIVVRSALRQDTYYIQIYIMWMYLLIMYLLPFLSLMIFNSFIYKEVRAANHERQRLSRLQRKEIGLAVMLLVVVTVFFLCNVLAFILNVLELSKITINELTITSNLLVTVNSSVNFIIYCTFGQKFRKLFLKMFCSRIIAASGGREGLGDSAIYANNSVYGESPRNLTNGRATTETIRLTSWSDHRHSSHLSNIHDVHRPSCASTNTAAGSRFLKRGMHFTEYNQMAPNSQCFD